jgi:hypothetical protein
MKPDKETPEQRASRLLENAYIRCNTIARDRCLIEVGKLKKKRGGLETYIRKHVSIVNGLSKKLKEKNDKLAIMRAYALL